MSPVLQVPDQAARSGPLYTQQETEMPNTKTVRADVILAQYRDVLRGWRRGRGGSARRACESGSGGHFDDR